MTMKNFNEWAKEILFSMETISNLKKTIIDFEQMVRLEKLPEMKLIDAEAFKTFFQEYKKLRDKLAEEENEYYIQTIKKITNK
jgi:hypothetical protein